MVLEAAINGHADIVTFNVRHFRAAAGLGIGVLRPADVLKLLKERSTTHGTK